MATNWKQPIPTGLNAIFGDDRACELLYRELIYRACNKDGVITHRKKTFPIKRGQVIFGRKEWSKYLLKPEKTVERWLKKLQNVYQLVAIEPSTTCTVVTIQNYDGKTKMASSWPAHGQLMATSKNVESGESEKNNTVIQEKTSKNALIPCTTEELEHITQITKAPMSLVNKIHADILDLIADGAFQKKRYGVSVYFTLIRWIKMRQEKEGSPTRSIKILNKPA